jgi:glucose/arabinose dehydrogenase
MLRDARVIGVSGIAAVVAATMLVPYPVALAQGGSPFSDFRTERPGAMYRIALADLPAPYATRHVDNPPTVVPRPAGAVPQTLPGYSATLYADGLENPRLIRVAPNGDLFVAESKPGRVRVIRGPSTPLGAAPSTQLGASREANGRAQTIETFATGLNRPFGIAFYPPGSTPEYVYVGNTDSVVRFPYQVGDLKARGPQEVVVPNLPSGGKLRGGGHWTRDIAFSRDGRKMYVGVGSDTNVDDPDENPAEKDRATILEFNTDGTGRRVFVSGIRNPVGLEIHPQSGQLWASVNERDGLGDNLVPDYITRVDEGDFYGWPWYYMGGTQDPRHEGKHPELKSKVKTPDVLIQPHSASLQMVFYTGTQFPAQHRDSIFAAQHGSWNKSLRTGYKVIRVPLKNGAATGEYEDFLTGFVTNDGYVWGRPVGVAVASDGALLVSDDGSNAIWRVSYGGSR